jgi:hypothetical protein
LTDLLPEGARKLIGEAIGDDAMGLWAALKMVYILISAARRVPSDIDPGLAAAYD